MKVVIVEDDVLYNNRILKNVHKVLEKEKLNLSILPFYDYNHSLKEIIYNNETKIYLLDVDLGGNSSSSGFDIAREIRERAHDWNSIIIIASAYNMKENFISARLSILTYISKFDDFDNNLRDTFKVALEIISSNNTVSINNHCKIYQNDILYALKEKYSKYCIIKTIDDEYRVGKNLIELEQELHLKKIKKHLLANENNIISIKNYEITFKNKEKIKIE